MPLRMMRFPAVLYSCYQFHSRCLSGDEIIFRHYLPIWNFSSLYFRPALALGFACFVNMLALPYRFILKLLWVIFHARLYYDIDAAFIYAFHAFSRFICTSFRLREPRYFVTRFNTDDTTHTITAIDMVTLRSRHQYDGIIWGCTTPATFWLWWAAH